MKKKKLHDILLSGTVNENKSFVMLCQQSFANSALTQLVIKVKSIKQQKLNVAKTVDKIAFFFTPIVIIFAIFTFIIQLFYGYQIYNLFHILP